MTDTAPPTSVRGDLTRLYYGLSRPVSGMQTAQLLADFRQLAKESFFGADKNGRAWDEWERGAFLAMVLQTRDLAGGKGEYGLFYLLMGELFLLDHQCSAPCTDSGAHGDSEAGDCISFSAAMVGIMESLVAVPSSGRDGEQAAAPSGQPRRPYGSWKDFRALLTHLREMVGEEELVQSAFFTGTVSIMVEQLRLDSCALSNPEEDLPISLVGKWAPRERSKKHGWLVKYLARSLQVARGQDEEGGGAEEDSPGGKSRCLADYRKLVSALNRRLRTPQVAQCAGRWRDIDFARDVTAGTMRRQRRAFQYPDWETTSANDPRTQDRQDCRLNYLGHLRDCAQGTATMKSHGLSPRTLVRDAIAINEDGEYTPREAAVAASAIDLQWWESRSVEDASAAIVPIVDTSSTMSMESDDPLCAAIGIGLRLAERSALGRRLVTFGTTPVWVNLEEQDTLTTAVREVRAASHAGGEADVATAFELVANACAEADLHPNVVKGLTVVLLSDADDGAWSPPAVLHERIAAMFRDAGKRSVHRCAYRPPHIVYWGLRTRQPLPCSTTAPGVSFLSGYSAPLELGMRTAGVSCLGETAPTPERAMAKALGRKGRYSWAWDLAKRVRPAPTRSSWIW